MPNMRAMAIEPPPFATDSFLNFMTFKFCTQADGNDLD